MRKLIAYVLCCSVLLLSWPAAAWADDSAKRYFIDNYLHYLDNSIKLQKASMESLLNNNMKAEIDVNLSDGKMVMMDGTTISNVNGSGRIETVSSFKDSMVQADYELNLPAKPEIKGSLYLNPEKLILTGEAFKALAEAGFDPGMDVETLPRYVVYTNFISEEDMAIFKESLNNGSLMAAYEKSDEIKVFTEKLLQIIPESCFSFSDGYAVLKLEPSIITSTALIKNLKANSEELAVSFAEIMAKPADMSEEEFSKMKNEMITQFVAMIDSLQITDLSKSEELDLPFQIEELKFSINDQQMKAAIHIKVDENGESYDLAYESSSKCGAGSMTGEAEMQISADTSFAVMDVTLQASTKITAEQSVQNLIISGEIGDGDQTVSGIITVDYDCDYNSNKQVTMPEVHDGNSITIDVAAEYYDPYEDYPAADLKENEFYVYVDGWVMYFEKARPMIMEDRIMLPIRELAEWLGCTVEWLPPDTVVISGGVREDMTLTINSNSYQVGDESYPCDVPPRIINDYTYVPVILIAEYFDFTVDWDEEVRSLMLMSDW
ncbi:MAG TPA: stalk domain-containing protein [Syntrophomonadaceae bacterium]|nr:stalk domain-containing protein [Syntrophomonadaceae bacterium]HRX20729.1 stalk domain-containing protein [Syntrophomonadaceae bacterium]